MRGRKIGPDDCSRTVESIGWCAGPDSGPASLSPRELPATDGVARILPTVGKPTQIMINGRIASSKEKRASQAKLSEPAEGQVGQEHSEHVIRGRGSLVAGYRGGRVFVSQGAERQ